MLHSQHWCARATFIYSLPTLAMWLLGSGHVVGVNRPHCEVLPCASLRANAEEHPVFVGLRVAGRTVLHCQGTWCYSPGVVSHERVLPFTCL